VRQVLGAVADHREVVRVVEPPPRAAQQASFASPPRTVHTVRDVPRLLSPSRSARA
jgi:hypothetical protein